MVGHFTPLGNHMSKNFLRENAVVLSTNIDVRFPKTSMYKRRTQESPLKHLQRVCVHFKSTRTNFSDHTQTTLERACLFLAIREQTKLRLRKETKD